MTREEMLVCAKERVANYCEWFKLGMSYGKHPEGTTWQGILKSLTNIDIKSVDNIDGLSDEQLRVLAKHGGQTYTPVGVKLHTRAELVAFAKELAAGMEQNIICLFFDGAFIVSDDTDSTDYTWHDALAEDTGVEVETFEDLETLPDNDLKRIAEAYGH